MKKNIKSNSKNKMIWKKIQKSNEKKILKECWKKPKNWSEVESRILYNKFNKI